MERPNKIDYLTTNQIEYNQLLCEYYDALEAYIDVIEKQLCGISNRFDLKYTPPFRVGRKQGKAVLDAKGIEVVFFNNSEEQARLYCDYLNG